MTIYLVRHGLAEAGVDALDPGLAPLGRQQADAAANALRDLRAGRLLVSPLRRTRETAEPIAEALTLEAEVRDEVAEVFDPSWPATERQAMIGPFMAGKWHDQPERLQDWRKRVLDAVLTAGLAAEASGLDLVIVSHYIAIGVAIGAATGDDRVVPIPMANASITRMTAGHGGLSLLEAASTAHLAPEQVTGFAMIGMGKA
ncbi:MAG: histidine phosphatase family protein [Dehalococcoidia bacterium]